MLKVSDVSNECWDQKGNSGRKRSASEVAGEFTSATLRATCAEMCPKIGQMHSSLSSIYHLAFIIICLGINPKLDLLDCIQWTKSTQSKKVKKNMRCSRALTRRGLHWRHRRTARCGGRRFPPAARETSTPSWNEKQKNKQPVTICSRHVTADADTRQRFFCTISMLKKDWRTFIFIHEKCLGAALDF